jgi:hypothetical protein
MLKILQLLVGNCDIHAEQKILVVNETKWYKNWSKLTFLVIKNFHNLLPNFVEFLKQSLLEFCPFCINES